MAAACKNHGGTRVVGAVLAGVKEGLKKKGAADKVRFAIAGFTQILGPAGKYQTGLVERLAGIGPPADRAQNERRQNRPNPKVSAKKSPG